MWQLTPTCRPTTCTGGPSSSTCRTNSARPQVLGPVSRCVLSRVSSSRGCGLQPPPTRSGESPLNDLPGARGYPRHTISCGSQLPKEPEARQEWRDQVDRHQPGRQQRQVLVSCSGIASVSINIQATLPRQQLPHRQRVRLIYTLRGVPRIRGSRSKLPVCGFIELGARLSGTPAPRIRLSSVPGNITWKYLHQSHGHTTGTRRSRGISSGATSSTEQQP